MNKKLTYGFIILLLLTLTLIISINPKIKQGIGRRLDLTSNFVRLLLHPVGDLPAPIVHASTAISTQASLNTPSPTITFSIEKPIVTQTTPPQNTPTSSATNMPMRVSLPSPKYESQDWNNCGPATLAMYLHFYGWQGSQFDISNLVKPTRADRNVNIDELAAYVTDNVPGYSTIYRVGGSANLLRRLIANNFPVIIEEGYYLEEPFWYGDDRWAGHYLLVTGYDDETHTFIAQDSFTTPNKSMDYLQVAKNWQSFNYIYMLMYPTEKEDTIKFLLGSDWNSDENYQNGMDLAEDEINSNKQDALAWFNLGSTLVYVEKYTEAAAAFDQARLLGLPQRILRYRFAPFMAYFHSGRTEELLSLTEYALQITPNSEEALLWHAWALYRMGEKTSALEELQKALQVYPDYSDALNAVEFINAN